MKKYVNRRKVPRRVRNRRRTKYSKRNSSRMLKKVAPSWYPFGKSRTCKLKYSETITIDPAMGVAGTYTFSANGLYDPNISGTGHQPYGFDQLCALYNHYHVTGARMKITCVTTNAYYIMGVKLCDTTTLNSSTPDYLMEQPAFRKRIIGNNASAVSPSIACNFSCKKFFRLKSKAFILADDTLQGSASYNPAEQAYFVIVLMPAVSSQDVATATFQVTIDYIATFTGPKELGAS